MATVLIGSGVGCDVVGGELPAVASGECGGEVAVKPKRDTSGELNANNKLSNAQVAEMRRVRFESLQPGPNGEPAKPVDWPELAAMFDVHPKHAYSLCLGKKRANAGGPIEDGQRPTREEVERNFIRCRCCGGKHQRFDECQRCQTLWAIGIQKMLAPFGKWVPVAANG